MAHWLERLIPREDSIAILRGIRFSGGAPEDRSPQGLLLGIVPRLICWHAMYESSLQVAEGHRNVSTFDRLPAVNDMVYPR